jgi:hypothetical protein
MRKPILALLVVFVGCTPLSGAVRSYDHGLYPDALASLQALETRSDSYGPREKARYALYRGLAQLALGDGPRATVWLRRARNAIAADPTLLSDDDMGRLASAWSHLPDGPVVRPLLDASAAP